MDHSTQKSADEGTDTAAEIDISDWRSVGDDPGRCSEAAAVIEFHRRCPFLHGTVRSDPYPGYVHGRHPEICSHGCRPAAPGVLDAEPPAARLKREALEWNALYHKEKQLSAEVCAARAKQILQSIETSGTYEHTFDELEYGARVAWRNSAKCINRQVCMELQLHDKRHVTTNREFFEAIIEHLRRASKGEAVTAVISLFRPSVPTSHSGTGAPVAIGPRVWNTQLVRFAGHELADGTILGDPAEAEFTKLVKETFGWVPTAPLGRFDVLPLVLQIDPNAPPELFELPADVVAVVDITHPRLGGFAELGLQWYAIPAVAGMDLSLGGLSYTAAPFNGWYMTAEVGTRNFGDASRYDMLPAVARLLGLNPRDETSMWREHALAALNEAVALFSAAGVSMANHHQVRRVLPRVVPWRAQGARLCPRQLEVDLPADGRLDDTALPRGPPMDRIHPPKLHLRTRLEAYLTRLLERCIPNDIAEESSRWQRARELFAVAPVAGASALPANLTEGDHACRLLVLFASVSGTTRARAAETARSLAAVAHVELLDLAEAFPPGLALDVGAERLRARLVDARAALFLTCTAGSGNVPSGGAELVLALRRAANQAAVHDDANVAAVAAEAAEARAGARARPLRRQGSSRKHLQSAGAHEHSALHNLQSALHRTPTAVYARGNSGYARYNAAGKALHSALDAAAHGSELLALRMGDELDDELGAFYAWLEAVVRALGERGLSDGPKCVALADSLRTTDEVNADAANRWEASPVDASLIGDDVVMGASGRSAASSVSTIVGVVSSVEELLQKRSHAHSTCLLKLDMQRAIARNPTRVTRYSPGDHVRVIAENPRWQVDIMCAHLGVDPSEAFDLHPHLRHGGKRCRHGRPATEQRCVRRAAAESRPACNGSGRAAVPRANYLPRRSHTLHCHNGPSERSTAHRVCRLPMHRRCGRGASIHPCQ